MEKIKHFVSSEKGKDFLTIIIVILVGLFSFGLGRLSKAGDMSSGLRIEYQDQASNVISGAENALESLAYKKSNTNTLIQEKSFFASNRGQKYYPTNCSAGKSIKLANRVYFDTREEAESKGYELSDSCR